VATKVECWRVYIKKEIASNSEAKKQQHFELAISKLVKATSEERGKVDPSTILSFIVDHDYFGQLTYIIDRVTPNADGGNIFTLSLKRTTDHEEFSQRRLLSDENLKFQTRLCEESDMYTQST
jgi:hypothetical protein